MKETYYTKDDNGNLKKAGNVIRTAKGYVTNPTAEDCAAMVDANGKPNPAYPRSEESFSPPKCDEGFHAVHDGYELQDGKWVRKWRVEELPPPPPRTFSKLKITAALMKIEKWLPVRDYLVQSGMYDLYLAAQDFKEDDEFFIKGLSELKAKFGMSDEEVEAILKEGVA
jgi:hypothetical protein